MGCSGSSPRVRGTVSPWREFTNHCRFIPACAGNGTTPPSTSATRSVHPRVCGERCHAQFGTPASAGSSPRVRGTVRQLTDDEQERRFIPACAGNGASPASPSPQGPVHPRVCGERDPNVGYGSLEDGSSPRVRGTGPCPASPSQSRRFIPACAGNGSSRRSRCRQSPVHPRVCGERCSRAEVFGGTIGSSPRVRGTGTPTSSGCATGRFIPACAGNGVVADRVRVQHAVHPRVCGERHGSTETRGRFIGSSPRVRGTV